MSLTARIVAGEDGMACSLFIGADGGGMAQAAMRDAFSPEAIGVDAALRARLVETLTEPALPL
ncbi:hypothetical protein GRI62_11000 [Erythrobacter arachoides]|uniref:Uncharacterized protein n=1 Tax=Aurantiacibacter arachoides TaxID=1850444 RepID=A0A845A3X3_9SPHN|nr:hypothetical protein [Aurantiacibacter arachoides]MXO94122.1 hypothetical protein [Aurantiacibacter arachoides]GGD65875.1 hypothetical protein GCM10011411_27870 [Aurantiacibacter arachoides]